MVGVELLDDLAPLTLICLHLLSLLESAVISLDNSLLFRSYGMYEFLCVSLFQYSVNFLYSSRENCWMVSHWTEVEAKWCDCQRTCPKVLPKLGLLLFYSSFANQLFCGILYWLEHIRVWWLSPRHWIFTSEQIHCWVINLAKFFTYEGRGISRKYWKSIVRRFN